VPNAASHVLDVTWRGLAAAEQVHSGKSVSLRSEKVGVLAELAEVGVGQTSACSKVCRKARFRRRPSCPVGPVT
jgi:hypothetical protein